MPNNPNAQMLSKDAADRAAKIISKREGVQYTFFRFLNLGRFSLVFMTQTNEQKVLTIDHVKDLLKSTE